MFELYARGDKTMADIAGFLKENGVITRGGKLFKDDKIKSILRNPFYYGNLDITVNFTKADIHP